MMRFLRVDIHELLTPDLLHQVIKGTYKDHLIQWVEDYLKIVHRPSKGKSILDEIDQWYVKITDISKHTSNFPQNHTHTSLLWSSEIQAGL